jgi:hypothetical protein
LASCCCSAAWGGSGIAHLWLMPQATFRRCSAANRRRPHPMLRKLRINLFSPDFAGSKVHFADISRESARQELLEFIFGVQMPKIPSPAILLPS